MYFLFRLNQNIGNWFCVAFLVSVAVLAAKKDKWKPTLRKQKQSDDEKQNKTKKSEPKNKIKTKWFMKSKVSELYLMFIFKISIHIYIVFTHDNKDVSQVNINNSFVS